MSKITNKTKDPYENFFRAIFDGSNRRVVIYDSEHFQHPEDFKDSVDYVLDGLTDREMTVIKMRFGFDGYEPSTWAKIADVLNCSIQRAQQIQRKVIYNITQSNKGIIIRDGLKRYNYELDKEVNELNPDCFINDNVKEYVETNPNTSFSKA